MFPSRSLLTDSQRLVLSPAARPLRFAGTGGLAGVVQLSLLSLMTRHGWQPIPANATAFLLAAQVNFALSATLTWRDRVGTGSVARRWLLFHGSIALMAVANMATFIAVRSVLPTLLASLAGIAAGALGNYLAGDRFVFRGRGESILHKNERRSAA